MYEIWVAAVALDSADAEPGSFFEDCQTYEEAVRAVKALRKPDQAAWIQNKETGEVISD